jgi:micrococcal nuclease
VWDRIGFAALCLATLLDAAWVISLLDADDAVPREPSARSRTGSDAPAYQDPREGPELPPTRVPDAAVPVRVLRHTDGDTLHVVPVSDSGALVAGADTTVRLLEIDTPESVDPNSPVECFSRRASDRLRELLPFGTRAWAIEDTEALDPFGRTLLYLWNSNGLFVNQAMVEEGLAKAVLFEPNDLYIRQMREAESRARGALRGLWGACGAPVRQLVGGGATPSPTHAANTDPRFAYCYQANDAGYGNYISGRDPEYMWYDDADGDGQVCEF